MITAGYVAEGYGPDAVIMCAPSSGTATLAFVAGSGAPDGALVSDGSSTPTAAYQGFVTADGQRQRRRARRKRRGHRVHP